LWLLWLLLQPTTLLQPQPLQLPLSLLNKVLQLR
jgi:hypothetical protein